MLRSLALYLAVGFAIPAGAAGEPPAPPLQVNVRAVPDKVKVGEPFRVEVVITHAKDQRYDLQPTPESESFDVAEQERTRLDGKDSATTTFRLPLSAFQLGKLKTPALTFDVWSNENKGTFTVPGVDVEVVSTLPPDAEKSGAGMFDITGPVDVAVRTLRLVYALAALLAAALAFWAVRKWLRRRRPLAPAAAKLAEPLEVRTRKALDLLRADELPAQGRVREFYFRLSEIVRGYLGERYDFDALECTTPELIEALQRLHTPGLQMRELQDFANESDFVRYAKGSVDPTGCKSALELAYSIVSATTPNGPPPAHARELRVS